MKKNNATPGVCQICKKRLGSKELIPWDIIRESIKGVILENYPELPSDGFICSCDQSRIISSISRQSLRYAIYMKR